MPWESPITTWREKCPYLEDVEKGLSRHPIVFVNISGVLYAVKQLPVDKAEDEYLTLKKMVDLRLPVVLPLGYTRIFDQHNDHSLLITRYLNSSLPYRTLFLQASLERYRKHLLDAIASLLVQLHLAGVYWGDCSLSNTLFRRDAGILQAYLVDAETANLQIGSLNPLQRSYDLEIMEENITGDLVDVERIRDAPIGIPISDIPAYIRLRYQELWTEVTRNEVFQPHENYRIQERIKKLNTMGFSVGDVKLVEENLGKMVSFKVVVTDRNYHKNELYSLTGLDAQEMEAVQLMNEINEVKYKISAESNRSVPLSAAAFHWMENYYRPTIEKITQSQIIEENLVEVYCQILEHKWFLSERASHDVGHTLATDDYIQTQLADKPL